MEIDWKKIAEERSHKIGELRKLVARLEARLSDLEERLNRNSSNSSIPPSTEGLSKPLSENRAGRHAKSVVQESSLALPAIILSKSKFLTKLWFTNLIGANLAVEIS